MYNIGPILGTPQKKLFLLLEDPARTGLIRPISPSLTQSHPLCQHLHSRRLTRCAHPLSAPEARRILPERSPVTRADCERAGGAARPFRKEFWSRRPSQYGTGTEALRGDTHCVHTVSAPEARRILAERSPVTRADCERAGGVAHPLARVSPVSCTGYRLLQRSILHRNPFLVLRPAGPPEGQARRTFLL